MMTIHCRVLQKDTQDFEFINSLGTMKTNDSSSAKEQSAGEK